MLIGIDEDRVTASLRYGDWHDLVIKFAVIDGDGETSPLLFAIGPLLKGSLWETTAVPELRSQAMRVAENLLQREPAAVEEEAVIEYYI